LFFEGGRAQKRHRNKTDETKPFKEESEFTGRRLFEK